MALAAFDTHEFVKTLEKAGLPEAQAEAISVAVQKSHEAANLATKADLHEYESVIRNDLGKLETSLRHEIGDLRHEIGDLRKDVFHEMRELESRLINKLGGLIVAGIAVIAALPAIFKLLHLG